MGAINPIKSDSGFWNSIKSGVESFYRSTAGVFGADRFHGAKIGEVNGDILKKLGVSDDGRGIKYDNAKQKIEEKIKQAGGLDKLIDQEISEFSHENFNKGIVLSDEQLEDFKKGTAERYRSILDTPRDKYIYGDAVDEDGRLRLSNSQMFHAMFMDKDTGNLAATRVGLGIAGGYMAANVIGHGSLGIPFISTASWNR